MFAIFDLPRGVTAVSYTYDAWSKIISWSTFDSGYAGLVYNNPLRYRGYCYDEDTGFYYLQSRVKSIKTNLSDIASKYGLYKCKEAAEAMKRYAKNKGKIIHLYFPDAYKGYVCCDRYTQAISTNGHHYGYLFDGIVYCNIYPERRLEKMWINSFYTAGHGRPIVSYM